MGNWEQGVRKSRGGGTREGEMQDSQGGGNPRGWELR